MVGMMVAWIRSIGYDRLALHPLAADPRKARLDDQFWGKSRRDRSLRTVGVAMLTERAKSRLQELNLARRIDF